MSDCSLYKRMVSERIRGRNGTDNINEKELKYILSGGPILDFGELGIELYKKRLKQLLVATSADVLLPDVNKTMIAIPFPLFWMETGKVRLNEGIADSQIQVGYLFFPEIKKTESYTKYRCISFIGHNGGVNAFTSYTFYFNEKNQITIVPKEEKEGNSECVDGEDYLYLSTSLSASSHEDAVKEKQMAMSIFLLMIDMLIWLSAKNVSLVENNFSEKTIKHFKKQTKSKADRYYVLSVILPSTRKHNDYLPSGKERITAYHLVRGHLRRYTEEKPLFGSLVGTFYIPSHARGNEEYGNIDKDYKFSRGI